MGTVEFFGTAIPWLRRADYPAGGPEVVGRNAVAACTVPLLEGHDGPILGRARCTPTVEGLTFIAVCDEEDPVVRELAEVARRGRLKASVGFASMETIPVPMPGGCGTVIRSATLDHVGLVTWPRYRSTRVDVREVATSTISKPSRASTSRPRSADRPRAGTSVSPRGASRPEFRVGPGGWQPCCELRDVMRGRCGCGPPSWAGRG
ncbi:MAG: hypothetical protein M3O70_21630 [Actinomycetota bacterium]|nr:hypothetical protein [Actinomycetota bacterium]